MLFKLESAVVVRHPSFWGAPASVEFAPAPDRRWYWQPRGGSPLALEPSLLAYKNRQLQLRWMGETYRVFEHVGALRFFGFHGVVIRSGRRQPYFTNGAQCWHQLKHCLVAEAGSVPLYTVAETVRWEYPTSRAGEIAFTEIAPSSTLELDISIAFSGLGTRRDRFCLPDEQLMEQFCAVASPPWPPRRQYWLTRTAALFGWPHHWTYPWAHRMPSEEALRLMTLHRAFDVLGALSLLCGNGLFTGRVRSHCSGHLADFNLVRQARIVPATLARAPLS